MANMNMEDPAVQEAIRRKPHQYIPTAGKHGQYVPLDPRHNRPENVAPFQEYPKMMLKEAQPQLKDFQKTKGGVLVPQDLALQNWQAAMSDWDSRMTASIVHSAEEEAEWKHKN